MRFLGQHLYGVVFSFSDDEEDGSRGINTYLSQALARRKVRQAHTGPFALEHVGPENRIVAACTFDKKYMWVYQLWFAMSVS